MDKNFEHDLLTKKWSSRYRQEGLERRAEVVEGEAFTVLMPPPNVTGVLHMGHLLNNTIQDILVRRARQQGKSAFWQLGTDHAGISLQVRVEKGLAERGIEAKSLSREEFLEEAVRWRDEHEAVILEQLQRLGVSCDFSKKVHTLDSAYSGTVLSGFVELFRRGYIYRGRRMVNWCPVSQTALSDEEVIMKPQMSKLYRVRYELVERPGEFIEVCTTRPETIPGDVALAVGPGDERYESLVGLHVWRPLCRQAIPIVVDEAVDQDFGTGALKITPAHDMVDFEMGQRHGLEALEVIGADGRMTELAGEALAGRDRFEARNLAAEELARIGALVAEEDYENAIGLSERSGVPIEPRLSDQWFLRYSQVAAAKRVLKEGFLRFFPERWSKTYIHWLDNIRDWCISRQLVWGHRIPVWYRRGADRNRPENWHVSLNGPSDPENWEQEEDVLDTWFSSAFWPLGTLGWPDREAMKRNHFDFFYPTSVLVTGPDILFFWVSRMIMMALEFLPEKSQALDNQQLREIVPFRSVYFTGIVRDELGRKMSKSLGNSPDPLELLEKYGADAVRFGLIFIAPQGQDVLFNEDRLLLGRNFCTKLWNACRLRQLSMGDEKNRSLEEILRRIRSSSLTEADEAILVGLIDMVGQLEECYENFELNGALQAADRFFRNDFCDWYLEYCKADPSDVQQAIQDLVLRQLLQQLHGVMPFITEELWSQLQFGEDLLERTRLVGQQELIELLGRDLSRENCELVSDLRSVLVDLRALLLRVGQKKGGLIYYRGECGDLVRKFGPLLTKLARFEKLSCEAFEESLPTVVTTWGVFALAVEGRDVESERQRLLAEKNRLEGLVVLNRNKLMNENFVKNAPPKVVEGARQLLRENGEKLRQVAALLKGLGS